MHLRASTLGHPARFKNQNHIVPIGNSKKPRDKNRASKILLSGDDTVIAVGGKNSGSKSDNTIDIQLVQIVIGVAAQTSVGDFVYLQRQGDSYKVYFDDQLLGSVPVTYTTTLLPNETYRGRLVKIAIYADPCVVVVRVRLSND